MMPHMNGKKMWKNGQPGTKVTPSARKLKRNPFPCELHTAGSATLFVFLEKVPQ
jgi:hypothetical protein